MSWQDDLDQLLSTLGVQQEYTQPEQPASAEVSEFSCTQASHKHPGVFYRLDLVDGTPELRVFVPTNEILLKVHVYLVLLSPHSFLFHFFGLYMCSSSGSLEFQAIEDTTTFHLFQAMIETMKGLFWRGDLAALRFPPEIDVRCLTC